MEEIPANVVQANREAIIEKSKMNFFIKSFRDQVGRIISIKTKLKSISAEWWIEANIVNSLNLGFYISFRFCLSQKPNQIQDLQKCTFGVFLGEQIRNTNWYQASNLSSWSSPKLCCFDYDETKNDLDINAFFAIKRLNIVTIDRIFNFSMDCCRDILNINSKMFNDPTFSDFTFVVKGKEFKVHKNVLAAASTVFSSIFLSNMKESRENLCTIEHIEPGIFEDLLHFIYEAKLADNWEENIKELYEVAHYYEVELLKNICANKAYNQLSAKNALDFYAMACTYDLEELKKSAWDIVKRDVFLIDFQIKGEPLSPKDLQNVIANRKSEEKFLKSLEEDEEINQQLEQIKL